MENQREVVISRWREKVSMRLAQDIMQEKLLPEAQPNTMVRAVQQFRLSLRSPHFRRTLYLAVTVAVVTCVVYYINSSSRVSTLSDGIFVSARVHGLRWGTAISLERVAPEVCVHPDRQKEFVIKALISSGGLFVGSLTMITPQVSAMAREMKGSGDMLMNVNEAFQGFVYVPSSMTKGEAPQGDVPVKYLKTLIKQCVDVVSIDETPGLVSETCCVRMSSSLNIYPKDIMTLDNKFGALARLAMYGTSAVQQAKPNDAALIPKLAHYWWIGDRPISYLMYLSILSQLFVVQVERVTVYGNREPVGEYWELLKQYPRVRYSYHEVYVNYHGQRVASPSLQSDIFRGEIIYKEGGIYMDSDALFVKPIDDLRGYDAVASLDIMAEKGKFPEYFNLGVTMGKAGASFWKNFNEANHKFRSDLYGYNGLALPYKLWEQNPTSIYHNPHLQVLCYYGRYRPTWVPNYLNVSVHHNTNFNWKTDAYAIHYTFPTPAAMESEVNLKSASATDEAATIARFILDKAGIKL
ncbi:hypothetical protein CAPTEDRAFT_224311 [Capitella teleta]|uniref:Uncharacterized protein n=1 Tax=Capitella teleta TaxID=283909 RepID=R7UDB3_CAPTE|nr:hypothetical protein CAPTEDRAFT_224311 [Capitella teleta]|eukprot:ELU01262.1 hypothetical protein CAPTEDRAFT_224311 [Capitella teleta]